MNEVTLSIGGKHYSIACDVGQEAHIAKLGGMIDAKIASLNGSKSHYDAQNLLFAALFLADDLVEARAELKPADDAADQAADVLENLADRIEKLAAKLEQHEPAT